MATSLDAAGVPIPTSAVLTASSKHIGASCLSENVAFLKCKKKEPNPEKCLEKGQQVTRCVLHLSKNSIGIPLPVFSQIHLFHKSKRERRKGTSQKKGLI